MLVGLSLLRAATIFPLFEQGYTVMPPPQRVVLLGGDFRFEDNVWRLELGAGVAANDVAVQTLHEELYARCGLRLARSGNSRRVITLAISPDRVRIGPVQDIDKKAIAEQAYRLDLSSSAIQIVANARPGLFYGVETLIQLLKRDNGSYWLPSARIEDWPDLEQRQIYWDDAHHLDRPYALKKAIRQAAFFKINGFVIKLEGHFQYKSAPALVEPQALAPADFQDLTNYALRYHVQLIPYVDAPAHVAFILKHPEYAGLREYPDSNYELCVTNPDSYKLLTGMFQDLMDANQGGKYFYLSTDEPYYVGLANNSQCREALRAKELGSVGRVLAEFVSKAANYLHDRGRTVIFWGEFPLKPNDLAYLPSHIVNGEVYGPQFDSEFKRLGIRQMIYTSTEGEEPLFPWYFALPASKLLHPRRPATERVQETFQKISYDSARQNADLMGMINAGWADMGLHPETFWLGYATAASAGWHPGVPDPRESMSTFYPLFYGRRVRNMDRVYQLMSTQAQIWTDTWDTVESTARKGIWGNSEGIYEKRRPAHDQTLPLPPAPGRGLSYDSEWAEKNAQRLRLVDESIIANQELTGLLLENVRRAEHNRYNLEVFLSIARLFEQNLRMLRSIAAIDQSLKSASDAARKDNAKQAMAAVDRALQLAVSIYRDRNRTLHEATETWYKTWFPRVAEANGRKVVHELDDVKDHLPDRTVDMSYLVYRELLLPFGEWVDRIRSARNEYARSHQMPVRSHGFNWKDLSPVSKVEASEISLE
ncbi:MAG TPA: family 20 glycosylhydrolase [Bryobacteraceae bacterium]|nr:family 20 glycosylhydrolase [Bryobacteraceae bacterium]